MTAPTPKVDSKHPQKSSLVKRLISGVFIVALTFACIFAGRWVFVGFVAVLAMVACFEWTRMISAENRGKIHHFAGAFGFLYIVLMAELNEFVYAPIFAIGGVALIYMHGKFRGLKLGLDRLAMGLIYILLSLGCLAFLGMYEGKFIEGPLKDLIFIPFNSEALKWIIAGLFVTIWSSDSIAYVVGRTVGGPKMAPKISPNKTWSGLCGSMLGAGLAMMGLSYGLVTHFDFAMPPLYTAFILGAVLGVVGQCGDLIVSHYKREYGLKDTGSIIPGHGGVLDRIDALLLMVPVCYIVFIQLF